MTFAIATRASGDAAQRRALPLAGARSGKYLYWNLDELEMADDLGFDGLGLNEHHQNGYGFPISPNMIATVLARRKSNAALVILGNTLPLYNPPIRVAEEFALLDCLSGGRLVAGLPGRLADGHRPDATEFRRPTCVRDITKRTI